MPILLIAALLVTGGGGISLAAEDAVPGDALYPVKVSINEEVRSAFAFGAEAEAHWEARRVERRLEEAETLAATGRLDAENIERLTKRFERHAQRVAALQERLEGRGDVPASSNVAARLEASLEAHERILSRLSSRVDDGASENNEEEEDETSDENDEDSETLSHRLSPLLRDIKLRTGALASAQGNFDAWAEAHDQPAVQQAAEQKRQATEKKLAEVARLIERHSERAGEERTAQAQAFLAEATDVYQDGVTALEDGAYARAFRLFQVSWKMAHRSMVVLTAQAVWSLDIEIGNASDVRRGDHRNDDANAGQNEETNDNEHDENEEEDEEENDNDNDGDDEQDDVGADASVSVEVEVAI